MVWMIRIAARAWACAFVLVCLAMVPVFEMQAQSFAPGTGRAGVSSRTATSRAELTAADKAQVRGAVFQGRAEKTLNATQKKTLKDAYRAKLEQKKQIALASRFILYPGTSSSPNNIQAPSSRILTATVNSSVDMDDLSFEVLNGTENYTATATVDDTNFSIQNCAGVINASHPCVIPVTYKPMKEGQASSTLKVVFALAGSPGTTVTVTVPLIGSGTQTCQTSDFAWLPLTHKDIRKNVVNCFFNASGSLDFVSQVQYAYNPSGSASTVGADLLAFNFMPGIQLVLGGNGSTNSCDQQTSGSSGTATTCGGSAAQTNDGTGSVQQAAQALQRGGDFYTRATWPMLNWRKHDLQALAVLSPRLGFTVAGLGDQTTGSGVNPLPQFAAELFVQYDAIGQDGGRDAPASVFVDWRPAYQHVGEDFRQAAGLDHKNFYLSQLAIGLAIKGGITISGQRFFGPALFFVDGNGKTSENNFGGWQIRLAINPKAFGKS
ncbi:hypothetical protein [Terriglobus tenax]|uniref:hypothetical protein n=1 Tax=Terriglobus tenax TaxID=1111115 RepID=UPI0021E062D3|nr:hypothetical protein [Terriglobus tenax]